MTAAAGAPAQARAAELVTALARVRARIAAAAARAGRAEGEVRLVAVSKTWPATDVVALHAAGQRDFGESREQELRAKSAAVAAALPADAAPPRWHFVGRLQTNKASRVAALAAVVHSLDRAELVPPLARPASGAGVLVQVNLDPAPGRGGVPPAGVVGLAETAASAGLRVLGVMAVAPVGLPPRPAFARLRACAEELRAQLPGAVEISAGMSADLEDAVAEGATLVRVGTALFGGRAAVLG